MIRIVIADDHGVLRAGLRLLISREDDMEVVAEAEDVTSTCAQAAAERPDVLILDLDMPGGGLRAIDEVAASSPRTRVLVLTLHDDMVYLRAALAAGAVGYIVKSAADTELLNAIRTVHQGRSHFTVTVGESEPEPTADLDPESRDRLSQLSSRERQVLELVALGYTHREIAEQVHLSVKTIETYRARIAQKLQLRSRAELVRYALDLGLLRSPEPARDLQSSSDTS